MFSFWSRKGNKSPGRTANLSFQSSQQLQDVELSRTTSRIAHIPNVPEKGADSPEQIPEGVGPEPVVAAVPNPHDAAVSEVHAKLLQAEQLSSTAHLPRPSHPLSDAVGPLNASPEPFFDPATGEQRGFFEAVASSSSGDSEQLRDEVWTHLARIRQIQSEIATMHRHMEGIGDESGAIIEDAEVDNDVYVDTVPTQEEEDRAKEFSRLPGRFKGRNDNIDVMMAKLNDLSQAVTSFHALQPPPLRFDSAPTLQQTTHSAPLGGRAPPVGTVRTRAGIPPTAIFGPKVILDQQPLHDSPIAAHDLFPLNIPKSL